MAELHASAASLQHAAVRSAEAPRPGTDGAAQYASGINPVQGVSCCFRTAYATEVLPLALQTLEYSVRAPVRCSAYACR